MIIFYLKFKLNKIQKFSWSHCSCLYLEKYYQNLYCNTYLLLDGHDYRLLEQKRNLFLLSIFVLLILYESLN